MLGATRTGALVDKVSVPPQPGQLSEIGLRDWETGKELVKTCLHTHDTATSVHLTPSQVTLADNSTFPSLAVCHLRLLISEFQTTGWMICLILPRTGTLKALGR